MIFKSTVEQYADGNQSWLGSRRGTFTARTVTIDGSTLAAFNGAVPSGVPLKKNMDGKYAPVTDAGDVLEGFLLTPQTKYGVADIVAPMIDTGRVRVNRLPDGAFDVSTLTAPNPRFVLVEA